MAAQWINGPYLRSCYIWTGGQAICRFPKFGMQLAQAKGISTGPSFSDAPIFLYVLPRNFVPFAKCITVRANRTLQICNESNLLNTISY